MRKFALGVSISMLAACGASEDEKVAAAAAEQLKASEPGICESAIRHMRFQAKNAPDGKELSTGLEHFEAVKSSCNKLEDEAYQTLAVDFVKSVYPNSDTVKFSNLEVIRPEDNPIPEAQLNRTDLSDEEMEHLKAIYATPVVKGNINTLVGFEVKLIPGLGWRPEFD